MHRIISLKPLAFVLVIITGTAAQAAAPRPHIVFVMADDMGWGETGYRNHPRLKTPNLDAMAAGGLRFERFYAGGPVCSPTRASVLTGRTHCRTGVLEHGYALRLQEKTIAQALRDAGYATSHFGKWHLDGLRGPGAPILADDPRKPGAFGFDEWVSVTNYFDLNPLMSRKGTIEQFQGDSSDIAVAEAVKFLDASRNAHKPAFAVIWFGSPHGPSKALPDDKKPFADLDNESANHYGELVALDRAVGTLRAKLREFKIADDTLLVFCSDNGGLGNIKPATVGGLRGNKGSIYEGGLRVPGIIEWPAGIKARVTNYPAFVVDLFPTVVDLLGLPTSVLMQPSDGISLKPLFAEEIAARERPLGFRYRDTGAWTDNGYKLVCESREQGRYALYDLTVDHAEAKDIAAEKPEVAERMKREFAAWDATVEASFAGKDYPEGRVSPPDPEPIAWQDSPLYKPYLAEWLKRPEYKAPVARAAKRKQK